MGELLALSVSLAAGLVLGAIFFGGLWWTVVRAISSKHPAMWLLVSKLLRMGVILGGFYVVGGGRWQRWLMCLSGFVLARVVAWRRARLPTRSLKPLSREGGHAP